MGFDYPPHRVKFICDECSKSRATSGRSNHHRGAERCAALARAFAALARPQPRRRALDQTLRSTVVEKHEDKADRHSDGFSIYREGGRLLQIHPAVSPP